VRTSSLSSSGSGTADGLDDHDLRLLRAIRDDPHEWSARIDFQNSPIDELRLYELARSGYAEHVGERFLWKLTPKGRVALAYHGEDEKTTRSLLHLEAVRGDGAPAYVRPPFVNGSADSSHDSGHPRSQEKLWPEESDECD